jgi:hypothetical protein
MYLVSTRLELSHPIRGGQFLGDDQDKSSWTILDISRFPHETNVNVYAIIIVLCISIDKSNIRTRSLRNTHSQETQYLSWETL